MPGAVPSPLRAPWNRHSPHLLHQPGNQCATGTGGLPKMTQLLGMEPGLPPLSLHAQNPGRFHGISCLQRRKQARGGSLGQNTSNWGVKKALGDTNGRQQKLWLLCCPCPLLTPQVTWALLLQASSRVGSGLDPQGSKAPPMPRRLPAIRGVGPWGLKHR